MKTLHALATGCMLTAGAVMIAPAATAQPARGDRPGFDREFSLTYEQAKERWPNLTRERFDALDTNGDGVLTPADRIGRGGERLGRPGAPGSLGVGPGPAREFSLTFEQAKERWPNLTRERFDAMDTDGDGVLTPADRPGWGDRPGRLGPPEGAPRRGQPEVAPEEGEAKTEEVQPPRFERRPRGERPRDGQGLPREFNLTFEQAQERFPNMTRQRFDAIDQNSDGVVTAEEFRAWRERTGAPGPRGDRPRDGRGPR